MDDQPGPHVPTSPSTTATSDSFGPNFPPSTPALPSNLSNSTQDRPRLAGQLIMLCDGVHMFLNIYVFKQDLDKLDIGDLLTRSSCVHALIITPSEHATVSMDIQPDFSGATYKRCYYNTEKLASFSTRNAWNSINMGAVFASIEKAIEGIGGSLSVEIDNFGPYLHQQIMCIAGGMKSAVKIWGLPDVLEFQEDSIDPQNTGGKENVPPHALATKRRVEQGYEDGSGGDRGYDRGPAKRQKLGVLYRARDGSAEVSET